MQLMRFAHGPATIKLGDLEVRRLGFGAMRLPGKDVWGEPDDPAAAHAVLRRAIELGINLIDTAWYYGPLVANRLIVEALHPYPRDLVIATKLGARRLPDKSWVPALRPDELRAGVEEDLRTLKLAQLPVVHLRWIDQRDVTFGEALDALIALRERGMLRHLALSNVTVAQLDEALAKTPIVAVQNVFNRCTPAQLALAWLLARSPVMLPIPGTSKVAHLDENVGSVHVALDAGTMSELAPNA
jgi:aryl-alcohol dehydrogenase-like predicted oxidoreductase